MSGAGFSLHQHPSRVMVAVCKSQEAAHKLDFHTLAAMADEAERRAKWEKAGGELNPDKFQNVCHKLVFWVICEVESHESKGFGKGLGISMDFMNCLRTFDLDMDKSFARLAVRFLAGCGRTSRSNRK